MEMPFEGDECEMEMYSMTGQIVFKRKVYSNGGVITETIDLSDQAKGLYMTQNRRASPPIRHHGEIKH